MKNKGIPKQRLAEILKQEIAAVLAENKGLNSPAADQFDDMKAELKKKEAAALASPKKKSNKLGTAAKAAFGAGGVYQGIQALQGLASAGSSAMEKIVSQMDPEVLAALVDAAQSIGSAIGLGEADDHRGNPNKPWQHPGMLPAGVESADDAAERLKLRKPMSKEEWAEIERSRKPWQHPGMLATENIHANIKKDLQMKITKTRLKQILQEELAAVAAEGWKHAQADTADAAASRDIDIYQTYQDVLHLSSYLDTKEERDVVEQAAEILKNYSGVLEEGELDEGTLEEYGIAYGIDRSGRVDKTNRLNKPTKEQMGCRDRDTGELVDHYWSERMGKWVCP